jgi:hypothetical protein
MLKKLRYVFSVDTKLLTVSVLTDIGIIHCYEAPRNVRHSFVTVLR